MVIDLGKMENNFYFLALDSRPEKIRIVLYSKMVQCVFGIEKLV